MGSLRRGLRVAVIAAILVALLTGVTFAAFPDVRAKVINTILDIYDTHTNFSFDSDVEKKLMPTSSELDIHVGWLPENFTKVNDVSNGTYTFERYENGEKVIRICKSLPYSIAVDTENAEITSIDIHGYEATLVKKSPEHSILWLNTDTSIVYFIYTNGVSPEIMLKIAENIS